MTFICKWADLGQIENPCDGPVHGVIVHERSARLFAVLCEGHVDEIRKNGSVHRLLSNDETLAEIVAEKLQRLG